jgi:hypothetical protein
LIVTAFVEVGAGIALLFLPAVTFTLLLGTSPAGPEVFLVGRVAGAGLLSIGVASWLARHDRSSAAERGLVTGILIYNTTVTVLLGYSGIVMKMAGILLWPAVLLHLGLAAWCCVCLRR